MSAVKSKAISNNNFGEIKKDDETRYGIQNYFILHAFALTVYLVVDNYLTYGIIKGPLEINSEFANYFRTNWLDVSGLLCGLAIQVVLGFVIEKSLALNYLPETTGLVCHGINLWAASVIFAITGYIVDRNRVAAHVSYGFIEYIFMKYLSYTFENKRGRDAYKAKQRSKLDHKDNNTSNYKKAIPYPGSVTFKNWIQCVVCTGSLLYDPPLKKTKRTWKEAFLFLFQFVFFLNISVFMGFQFVVPELPYIKPYVDQQEYLQLFRLFFKVVVPVMIIWIVLYYYVCFEMFFRFHTAAWGYEGEAYALDWWNAVHFTEYWSKWNYHVHKNFKINVFIPLLKRGYSKRMAAFAVAIFSGLIHEFLVTATMRCCYGFGMFTMLVQIPFAIFTTKVSKMFGRRIGNVTTLFFLLGSYALMIFIITYELEKQKCYG